MFGHVDYEATPLLLIRRVAPATFDVRCVGGPCCFGHPSPKLKPIYVVCVRMYIPGRLMISHHGMSPARVELVLNCLKMLRCHRSLSCDPASKVGKMVLLGISLVTWTDAARRKPLGQPPQRGVVEPLHLNTSRAPSQGNSH